MLNILFNLVMLLDPIREQAFLYDLILKGNFVHFHYVLSYRAGLVRQNHLHLPQFIHYSLSLNHSPFYFLILHYILAKTKPSYHKEHSQ
jgi:hypothetical protein